MYDEILKQILAKLDQHIGKDPEFKIPGAGIHRYQLGPRWTEAQASEFEASHGLRLPQAYREFLLNAGNGGAGPCSGLLPLREANNGHPRFEGEGAQIDLTRPFPHTTEWNAPALSAGAGTGRQATARWFRAASRRRSTKRQRRSWSPRPSWATHRSRSG